MDDNPICQKAFFFGAFVPRFTNQYREEFPDARDCLSRSVSRLSTEPFWNIPVIPRRAGDIS